MRKSAARLIGKEEVPAGQIMRAGGHIGEWDVGDVLLQLPSANFYGQHDDLSVMLPGAWQLNMEDCHEGRGRGHR